MLRHKNIFRATVFVAISGILYGFLGFLGTQIMRDNISINTMLFWRFFIASSWMSLFAIKTYLARKKFKSLTRILY